MRIADQILNKTAREAHLPINQNMVSAGSNVNNNTLLDALNKKEKTESKSVTTASKKYYEQLGKDAEGLRKHADGLLKTLDNVQEPKEAKDSINAFLESWNDTYQKLKKSESMLDHEYASLMREAAIENKNAFETIGIGMKESGSLAIIDEKKFEEASMDDLNTIIGSGGSFVEKTDMVAEHIISNADANIESVKSNYGKYSSVYSDFEKSKYDFLG